MPIIDGGIVFAGLIPQRPDDKFGASVIYARFSDSVRAFDRDTIAFTGVPGVIRDYEANLELTYQAQIVPGWIGAADLCSSSGIRTATPAATRWSPACVRSGGIEPQVQVSKRVLELTSFT